MTTKELLDEVLKGVLLIVGEYRGSHAELGIVRMSLFFILKADQNGSLAVRITF